LGCGKKSLITAYMFSNFDKIGPSRVWRRTDTQTKMP